MRTSEHHVGTSSDQAKVCAGNGNFVRDMNVLPHSYNYFEAKEEIQGWRPDLTKLPKDENGIPLFVLTRRGYERVIPVVPGAKLSSCEFRGVKKVLTVQGQRELIRELGLTYAQQIADKHKVPLLIQPGDENIEGDPVEIKRFEVKNQKSKNPWIREDHEERW